MSDGPQVIRGTRAVLVVNGAEVPLEALSIAHDDGRGDPLGTEFEGLSGTIDIELTAASREVLRRAVGIDDASEGSSYWRRRDFFAPAERKARRDRRRALEGWRLSLSSKRWRPARLSWPKDQRHGERRINARLRAAAAGDGIPF